MLPATKMSRLELSTQTLFLCERIEIARFLQVYLKHLFKQGEKLPNVQIINYHKLEKLDALSVQLKQLVAGSTVQRAVFFADAADEREQRVQQLFSIRDNCFFRDVKHCSHFFFPGRRSNKRWRNGYLEDLLLEALRQETETFPSCCGLLNIASEYLLTVNNCRGKQNQLSNYSRHLLYAYLAASDKYTGMRLDEAALAGVFDLQHPCFNSLRTCLLTLKSN